MEPRRVALAVLLMAAVLIATPYLFPPPAVTPNAAATAQASADSLAGSTGQNAITGGAADNAAGGTERSGAAATNAGQAQGVIGGEQATRADAGDTAGDSAAPGTAAVATVPVDTTLVNTVLADFRTSNMGAALVGATFRSYPELSNKGKVHGGPVELAVSNLPLLSYRVVVPGDTIALDRLVFSESTSSENGVTKVSYTADLPGAGARQVAIDYSFLPDSYRVNVSAHLRGNAENTFLLVDLPRGFNSSEADSTEDERHLSYAYKNELRGAKAVTFRSLDPGELRVESGPITWAVAKNKYFMVGVLTPVGGQGFLEADFVGGPRTGKRATRGEGTLVAALGSGAVNFEVYAGPQEFKRLVAMGREFETSNPYGGWIQGIIQPFATMVIQLLLWMKATLGLSYGWILVIFGVAVRVILWPLNQRAMRSQLAMQRIQPELQDIQKRYKGNPQQLQTAMMQLYKEHGMSPFSSLSGCLPMLIPMPVFFALFFVFQNTIEFRGVPFLWFPDISVKDPYYIIPVLVAVTSYLMTWIGMRGTKSNDQQKMMLYLMPGIMLIFFANFASGLNIYYFIQNLASLPQQWFIARERRKASPAVVKG